MIRGLFAKTIREVWPITLCFTLAVLAFEMFIAFILPSMRVYEELADQWLQVPFVRNMLKGLFGAEIDALFEGAAFSAIAWVHPVVLTLLWAQVITFCTRTPAGEIDGGTVDFLLGGLPVSRWRLYVSETLMGLACTAVLVIAGLIGSWLGSFAAPPENRPDFGLMLVMAVNCYCLCAAVGGLALLISSLSERRGKVVAIVVGIVLASFFLNFLAQFSETARSLSFLSVLHYHQPFFVLRDGAWPVADMAVLLGVAAALWLAGGIFFARRDICTT